MKTAISLPDPLFERVTARAMEAGISRSRIFAEATERYLDATDRAAATRDINDALDAIAATSSGSGDDSNAAAAAAGRRFLAAGNGESPDAEW